MNDEHNEETKKAYIFARPVSHLVPLATDSHCFCLTHATTIRIREQSSSCGASLPQLQYRDFCLPFFCSLVDFKRMGFGWVESRV